MSAVPAIDVRDLKSVRHAADRIRRQEEADAQAQPGAILGADAVTPETAAAPRRRRGILTLNRSPLARRIITFNLIALILLVSGMLYLGPARENLALQRMNSLQTEALLIAEVVAARQTANPVPPPAELLAGLSLRDGASLGLFDGNGALLAARQAVTPAGAGADARSTFITNLLNDAWDWLAARVAPAAAPVTGDLQAEAAALARRAIATGPISEMERGADGGMFFSVATPVGAGGDIPAAVVLTSGAGDIDSLLRSEREKILKMFLLGVVVSIGLSLVLASTIANPIADLAAAAESGRDRNARSISPTRVRIPDLTARPDEIGRLSAAMRGMVTALYDRIESNEQFAADVAHEIKNPLASLRSAVETMRITKRDDQREKLLDIIDHDVERLNRLVTDISTASRLDSELVREEEKPFDLMKMLSTLGGHLAREAKAKGVDFITDLPEDPVMLQGLEGRLAQVFVNLISNATSFCEEGDAIRLWARRRDNRILVVVEDTGPGIPEDALTRIFQRFYSQRPNEHFGNNSGLGLAISKQIVEAHGGVIWAENIRPTEADATSEPLGARFVVGLPV